METKNTVNIILLILIFASFIFLGLPTYQKFRDSQMELSQKKQELKVKESYFEKLKQIAEELKNYQPEINKISSAVPESADTVNVIYFLLKTANADGLITTGFGLDKSIPLEKDSNIKKTAFKISFVGPYLSFKKFLFDIEKNARLINFQYIKFSKEAGADNFNFESNVIINSY